MIFIIFPILFIAFQRVLQTTDVIVVKIRIASFRSWDEKAHFLAAVWSSSKEICERFPSYFFLDDFTQSKINEHIIFLDPAITNVVLFDVHMNKLDCMQLEHLFLQLATIWGKGLGVVLVLAVFHRVGYTVIVDHEVEAHLVADHWANSNYWGYLWKAELSQKHFNRWADFLRHYLLWFVFLEEGCLDCDELVFKAGLENSSKGSTAFLIGQIMRKQSIDIDNANVFEGKVSYFHINLNDLIIVGMIDYFNDSLLTELLLCIVGDVVSANGINELTLQFIKVILASLSIEFSAIP